MSSIKSKSKLFFLFCFFVLFCLPKLLADDHKEDKYTLAMELCIKNGNDSAFVFAKAILESEDNNPHAKEAVKYFMCFCNTSKKYHDDMLKICNDVIKNCDDKYYIALAWYQKSSISYFINDDKNCLIYSDICLEVFNSIEPLKYSKEGEDISHREFREGMCRLRKVKIHSINKDFKKLNDEKIEAKKFYWIGNLIEKYENGK